MDTINTSKRVDDAILEALPPGTVVNDVTPWGDSGWTETLRVDTTSKNGEQTEYFLKKCNDPVAEDMFRGEFSSLHRMRELLPEACPEPIAWGECKSNSGTFFLIMEFLYMIPNEPSPEKLARMIASVHKATSGTSPDNQFGFYNPTCHGKILQPNVWDKNWTRYFSNLLTIEYEMDVERNGPSPGYDMAFAKLKEKTIPRLLDALTANGREIVPCLVHGDLWHQNVGINEETDEPMVYDPSVFYAHNEYELGMWRVSCSHFDDPYRKQYSLLIPPSLPMDEWDDRNRLYSISFHICHSFGWPKLSEETRVLILEDMHYLNKKYGGEATSLAQI